MRTDLPPTGRAMHMIFGRRGFFGYAVRPDGDTYWFSNFAPEGRAGARRALNAERSYRQQLLRRTTAIRRKSCGSCRRCRERSAPGRYYDIPSLPTWHRGRVCLLGDAAHAVGPHVGQGSSLALEDAFVLAKCLRDIPDASRAFSTFERVRRSRVEPISEAVATDRTAEGANRMAGPQDPRCDPAGVPEEQRTGGERALSLCNRLGGTDRVTRLYFRKQLESRLADRSSDDPHGYGVDPSSFNGFLPREDPEAVADRGGVDEEVELVAAGS